MNYNVIALFVFGIVVLCLLYLVELYLEGGFR